MTRPGERRLAVDELLAAKNAGAELDAGPRIPVSSHFIESELNRLEHLDAVRTARAQATERLNELFRAMLIEVWGGV